MRGALVLAGVLLSWHGPPKSGQLSSLVVNRLSSQMGEAQVGDWVAYQIEAGPNRRGHWRIAVVGEQDDAFGRPAFWVEIEMGLDPQLSAPLVQLRMLAAKEAGISPSGVSRFIVAFGYDRPQELEPDAIAAILSRPRNLEVSRGPNRSGEARVHRGEPRRLLTAAGTVSATPVEVLYRRTVIQRFWISQQVPVLHLARIELPAASHVMEATGYGHDAKPRMAPPDPNARRIHLEQELDALLDF